MAFCALLGLHSAQAQTTEASPVYSTGYNASNLVMQNVSYTDGTAPLRGFLAYDKTFNATRPVVVIFPDYDGIGPYEVNLLRHVMDHHSTNAIVARGGSPRSPIWNPALPLSTSNFHWPEHDELATCTSFGS